MGHIHEDDIVRRLHSLGEQPIDPGVAHRHTSMLGGGPVEAGRRRRPVVTAAFLAGILLGGTGLAAAGPGDVASQASDAAKAALAKVNLVEDEPKTAAQEAEKAAAKAARARAKAARVAGQGGAGGTARYYGPECVGFTSGNHGQYVKAHPDQPGTGPNERQLAAESDCGKPCVAVPNPGGACAAALAAKAAKASGQPKTNSADDAGKGKPASPGKSDETHPSSTAGATGTAESGGPGKAEEHRPEGAGPTSTP